ncbi:GAD-like domain-containing protein [Criibacterium bergeronii]
MPNELISVWESYGFGTLLDGYLKIINPDKY